MLSSDGSFQRARPWYKCGKEGSNHAADNAVTLKELFQNKAVVFFGIPAPFTGTCSLEHYPGYKRLAEDFIALGCDEIVCYSVTDPYAHYCWSRSLGNDEKKISFLADPGASFAREFGLLGKYEKLGLGERSIRFSMIVVDGKVTNFHVVDDAVADAHRLLEELKQLKETKYSLAGRRKEGPPFNPKRIANKIDWF